MQLIKLIYLNLLRDFQDFHSALYNIFLRFNVLRFLFLYRNFRVNTLLLVQDKTRLRILINLQLGFININER